MYNVFVLNFCSKSCAFRSAIFSKPSIVITLSIIILNNKSCIKEFTVSIDIVLTPLLPISHVIKPSLLSNVSDSSSKAPKTNVSLYTSNSI